MNPYDTNPFYRSSIKSKPDTGSEQQRAKGNNLLKKDNFNMTELEYYQLNSKSTYGHIKTDNHEVVYPVLGLCSEVGEIADKIKKEFRDRNGLFSVGFIEDLESELGDVLWYVTQIASIFGISMSAVAHKNLDKLADRKLRNMIHGDGDYR